MTTVDTLPCMNLGEHLSVQRHAREECPTEITQADEDRESEAAYMARYPGVL